MNYDNFKNKRILVFGDSNTYGFNPEQEARYDDNTRYTCVLQKLLGGNYTVIEEGLPGRTAIFDDPVSEGLCGLSYITPCMNSHSPIDTVVIMLGTNDCKERFACNSTLIASGIVRLAQKAANTAAWRTKPQILIVCPAVIKPEYYTTGIFKNAMGTGCDVRSKGLAAELEAACKNAGFDFLNANNINGVENHPIDSMHLSASAHSALAKALYEILK